mgnify:FL=1
MQTHSKGDDAAHGQNSQGDHNSVESPHQTHQSKATTTLRKVPAVKTAAHATSSCISPILVRTTGMAASFGAAQWTTAPHTLHLTPCETTKDSPAACSSRTKPFYPPCLHTTTMAAAQMCNGLASAAAATRCDITVSLVAYIHLESSRDPFPTS